MNFSKKKSNLLFSLSNKTVNIFILFNIIFFLSISCGASSDEASSISSLEEKSDSSDDCLEPFFGKPENIFSQEMVAKYVDFQGSEVEYSTLAEALNQKELSKSYLAIAFAQVEWEVDGKRHQVKWGSIKKVNLYKSKTLEDRFYAKYHTKSAEEQAELTEALDKEVAKETSDENAKSITDGIGMDFKYSKVDGLSDAAVWEYELNDLIVLLGNYQFTIHVELNKGNDYDLEKAKLIAQAVIDEVCK